MIRTGRPHADMKCRPPVLLFAAFLAARAAAMDPAEQMQFADGLYVRGLYDMAVKEYLLIARDAPRFESLETVLFRIGECYFKLDQGPLADRFYRRVSAEYPGGRFRHRADLRRAELLINGAQYEAAAQALRSALESGPPDEIAAGARYYLGHSLARSGRPDEAEQPLREVVTRHEASPYASYAALELAEILGAKPGRGDERADLCRRAAEHPATPRLGAEALFQWGRIEFERADYAESAKAYTRLLQEYPRDERAGEARLQAAWSLYHTGQAQAALDLANARASAFGADAESWLYLRANCERQLGKTADALATYDELAGRYPGGPLASAARYEQALIRFRAGEFEAVLRLLPAAGAGGAIEEDACWLRAESHAELKQDAEAIRFFRMLAEKFPDSPRAAPALFRAAQRVQEGGDLDAASAAYRELAGKHPDHELAPAAVFSSAYCLTRRERYDEALKDWTRFADRYADHEQAGDATYQKALAEWRLARYGEARASLENLLKRRPESALAPDARYHLGLLLEQDKDLAGAERELQAARAAARSDELRNRAEFRLSNVLQKQGRADEAAAILQRLLSTPVRADMPPALLEWLARHLLNRGEFAASRAAAEALTKSAREPAWQQIGRYLVGRCRQGEGEPREAMKAYEAALAADARTEDAADAALRLGQLAAEGGDFGRAETNLSRAAELASAPGQAALRARSYHALGRAAEAQSKWSAAARYFMSVAVLFDDPALTPECLFRAADVFGKAGQGGERDRALQELRTRYPDSEWAAKADGGAAR